MHSSPTRCAEMPTPVVHVLQFPVRPDVGGLRAVEPDPACVPSQNGFVPDWPQRHSA